MKSVGSEGPDSAELLIVGPAPTAPEIEAGQLFTGKRGSTLWNALRYLKLDRPDVRIINVINELPLGANNMPTETQVAANRERFEREVHASKAKVVLVLGSFALKQTMGLRGKIDDLNGYVFYPSDAKLVPTKARGIVGEYKTSRKCSACNGSGSTASALTCVKCTGSGYSAKKGDPRYGLIHASKAPTLPETAKIIIPTLHPETIRLMGFKTIHAFSVSVERAVRAMRAGGEIKVVAEDDYIGFPMVPPSAVTQVAVDIENDIESGAIHRIGFAWRVPAGNIVTWTSPWNMAAKQASKAILENPDIRKIAHNIMHDASHLEAHGIKMKGEWYCTMQAGATIQPDLLKGLGRMAPIYLDVRTWKEKADSEPAKYNALDAKVDLLLAEAQQEEIAELGMEWVIKNTMAVYPTLLKMTQVGINVDVPRMQAWNKGLTTKLKELRAMWVKEAGVVNFLSNKQLGKYLYHDLGLPMQFNKFGRMTADEEAIKVLSNLAPKHKRKFEILMELRETSKQLSTYANVVTGGDGRVHPRYTPAYKDVVEKFGARGGMPATGRLASNGPNIQNQTGEAKLLFIPSHAGLSLAEFDYSQLELRIIAGLSGDKVMQADLDSEGGIHVATMKALGITNKVIAKNINFGTAYGAGPRKLAKMLQMQGIAINESEAAAFQSKLFSRYRGWYAYRESITTEVTTYKRITNAFGRSRPFYGGSADVPKALDFPPQSCAADMVLNRLPGVAEIAEHHGGNLLTSVHDSFLVEVRKEGLQTAIRQIKEHLEAPFEQIAPGFFVPVGIKVSHKSWGEMEPYNV